MRDVGSDVPAKLLPKPRHDLGSTSCRARRAIHGEIQYPMPLVVVRMSRCPSLPQRQWQPRTLERLDRGLLVDAKHDRVVGWVEVQPADIVHPSRRTLGRVSSGCPRRRSARNRIRPSKATARRSCSGREELRRIFRDGRITLVPQPGGFYIARSEILPLVLAPPAPQEDLGGGYPASSYAGRI
jgi:hypothetical protein